MRRFFPIIISVILLCSILFTGCNSSDQTDVSTKDTVKNNYELLISSFAEKEDPVTFDEFAKVISEWANENDIDVVTVNDKYLVLSRDVSSEILDLENFAFHTAVSFDDSESADQSFSTAAALMTLLENAQNQNELLGIFTFVKNGEPIGAEAINPDYLDSDNFIDIVYNKDTVLYNTFAASSDMAAVKELTITEPQYTKAYKIKFKGVENQSAYKNRGTYPNPIKTVGDLLASCQTSTILFELASFSGGTSGDMIPAQVTATIVLQENDVESFTNKFNNSYEKIEESYEDIDDENISFEYTFEPVDLPSEVISKEDTENIVSLMYTMINGTYLRNDNDEVEAFSNIGKVSTTADNFKLTINAKSLNDKVMTELEDTVETICGLSDINYKKYSDSAVWTNAPESALVSAMSDALNTDPAAVLEMKQVSALIEHNSEINLISWGTNLNDAEKDIDKILEYMSIAGIEPAE